MDFIKRDDIKKNALPGRVVQNAVGHNSAVLSEKISRPLKYTSPAVFS